MADEVWSGPWFSLYAQEWLNSEDVAAMGDAAAGFYLRLLCWEWVKGSIPADPIRIAAVFQRPEEYVLGLWPKLAPCFAPHPTEPGRLVNPRLEAERTEAMGRIQQKREAGATGGKTGRRSAGSTAEAALEHRSSKTQAALEQRSSTAQAALEHNPSAARQHGHGHGHEDLAAGASLSSSSLVGAGADTEQEREISHPKGPLPDRNATAPASNPETRPPPNAGRAAVDAVKAAWEERYRTATGQMPDWGVRTNACASRLVAIPLPELGARMGRFLAGAPAGFWRTVRRGEFPDLLGFEMVVGRLVDAPLPVAQAPPAAPEARSRPKVHSRIAAEFARYQGLATTSEPRPVDVRVVAPSAGLPPPALVLAEAGGES